jgi:triacylglycerol lipase
MGDPGSNNSRAPTFPNLVLPSETYPYFFHIVEHPFEPSESGFSLSNASVLADASLLAYGGEELIKAQAPHMFPKGAAGPEPSLISGSWHGGHCFIASSPQFAVVAFRGTRIDRFPDFVAHLQSGAVNIADLLIGWDAAPLAGGKVHPGFRSAVDEIMPGLRNALDRLAGQPLWLTGHSLGAALATVAATDLDQAGVKVQGLYTFGSPRVGSADFARDFAVPCFRVVNDDDVVPHLPLNIAPADYQHVKPPIFIDSNGAIGDDPTRFDEQKVTFDLGRLRRSLRLSPSGLPSLGRCEILLPPLSNHSPLYYARRLKFALLREAH